MSKILCPKVYELANRMCDLSKYATKQAVERGQVPEFHGFRDMRMMFMRHLIREQKNVCFGSKIPFNLIYKFDEDGNREAYKTTDVYYKDFELCGKEKKEVIFYDLSMALRVLSKEDEEEVGSWDEGERKVVEDRFLQNRKRTGGHSMLLTIVPMAKSYEIFDSNGTATYYAEAVNGFVKKWLNEHGYSGYSQDEIDCPVGIQDLTGEGRCENWSMLMLYLHLQCPEYEENDWRLIYSDLLAQGKNFLIRLNLGWTCFMWAYADISGIVEAYNRVRNHPNSAYFTRFLEGDLSVLQEP